MQAKNIKSSNISHDRKIREFEENQMDRRWQIATKNQQTKEVIEWNCR